MIKLFQIAMNIKLLVNKYGGQTALAKALGVRQSAVAYWVKQNAIPGKWHQKLLSLAQEQGVDMLPTDLLGIDVGSQDVSRQVNSGLSDAAPSAVDAAVHAMSSGNVQEGAEQFLFYASDNGSIKIQVLLGDETVWASQKGMAGIFDTSRENITIHLKNIFESNELDEISVCKESLLPATDGKHYKTKIYNLDAIISVGYRVNSHKATQFRRWATTVLKEYLIKGFTLDDERLKQGNRLFEQDYFDELLERIRTIRTSERMFWQKITDVYSQCSVDYDKNSPVTQAFLRKSKTNSTMPFIAILLQN